VFDAGSTPRARPYFVMELLHGTPITGYCDTIRLTLEERRRTVHPRVPRDSACAPEGHHPPRHQTVKRPRHPARQHASAVIDFGLAKALGHEINDASITNVGTVVGTLQYMSPEQAALTRDGLGTRSS
jgi:hypothetical protein